MTTIILSILVISVLVIAAIVLQKHDAKSRKYRIVEKIDNLKGEKKYVIEYRSFLQRSWSPHIPIGVGMKKANFNFDNEEVADRQYKVLIGEHERYTKRVIKSN